MRIRMLLGAVLTTLIIGAAVPAAQAGQRRQMVRAINYVRSLNNRHHLRFSARLSRGAAAWAHHLMRLQILGHASGVQGEVIEWHTGGGALINRTVTEWWNSSEHRDVMLGSFRRAGAGRAVGYFGGRLCTIWVARFGR